MIRFRYEFHDNLMFFTVCSEEIVYAHCLITSTYTHPGKFLWSTTAAPIRTPLLDVRPGTLSMRMGRGSAAGAPYGEFYERIFVGNFEILEGICKGKIF